MLEQYTHCLFAVKWQFAVKAVATAMLLALIFFGSLSAADHGGDIAPPVLVAASADRLQIDTAGAAQTITFTLRITDDLAGVRSVHVGFRHQNGYNESRECQQWPGGQQKDATLLCAVTWPRYSADGRWLVTWLSMSDGVGNYTSGNVAECVRYAGGRCELYQYNDLATPVVRAMTVQIGPSVPGEDPPLYLPFVIR